MTRGTASKADLQLETLASRVRAQFAVPDESRAEETPSAIEDALRRAFQRVADDLDAIERLHLAGQAINFPELLGPLADEKIAMILLLAKYTLQDVALCPVESLDIEYAHRDVALYAETLYQAQAQEGLASLYDLAVERGDKGAQRYWHNVALHCLFLIALTKDCHDGAIAFLSARPHAQRHLEELMARTQPEVPRRLRELLTASQQAQPASAPAEPSPYLRLFHQDDPGLPYDDALGTCSLISAERRIHAALDADDLAAVVRWFLAGSPRAVGELLRCARSLLPTRQYASLLEALLVPRRAHLRRLAAVVLQLGVVNRAERPAGGDAEINRLLVDVAMTKLRKRVGVARLAVRELAAVGNTDALTYLAENASLLEAAEQAVIGMKDLRRLLLLEPAVARRPDLFPAYREAHEELVEIQNLVDAVWSATSAEMAVPYIARLQALNAEPELERIRKLATRGKFLTRKPRR